MPTSYIFYIYERTRTIPEELFREVELLNNRLKLVELEKQNLEKQNQQLSEESNSWTQKKNKFRY